MITNNKTTEIEKRALLSTLWIFVLLNVIFKDIHDLFRPGFLAEMMTGIINGTQVTEEILLIGSIMVEFPILMVLLSRILKYKINRLLNIIMGVITIAITISRNIQDLDDIFFMIIEVLTLSFIVWYAWKWRK